MTHKFDAKNKHKLNNATRRKLLPPEGTLIKLGLQQGDTIADIGCEIRYFSIPAYEIVGEKGKIFAMDILPEMIQQAEINKKNSFSPRTISHYGMGKNSRRIWPSPGA